MLTFNAEDLTIENEGSPVGTVLGSSAFPCLGDPESDDPAERDAAANHDKRAIEIGHLWAAAPGLLDAIKGILEVPEALEALANWGTDQLIAARSAIAKAEAHP